MSGQLVIEIPVEPWLYQYLNHRISESPWKVTLNSYDGKLLLSNMGGKQDQVKKVEFYDKKTDKIIYKIVVPWKFATRYSKYTLTPEGVDTFVCYYQNLFKRELILWVESRIQLKKVVTGKGNIYIKEAILDFCKKNGLEEDHIPFETLKKKVYREFAQRKKQAVFVNS